MVRKDLKVWLVWLVFCGLLMCGTAGKCLADASAQISQARAFTSNGDYGQAEGIYLDIIANCSDKGYLCDAQTYLVNVYLKQGKDAEAGAALDKLVSDFPERLSTPGELYFVAEKYNQIKRYEEAEIYFQQVVTNFPDDAFGALVDLVYIYTPQKRYSEAEEVVDKLIADFSGHPKAPGKFYSIAGKYERLKKYKQAEKLYEAILANYPSSDCVLESQEHMIYMLNEQNIDAGGAIDKLVSDFNDNSGLPKALLDIAIRFEMKEKYSESRGVYGRLAQVHPNSPYGAEVAAETLDYFESGDYGKTLAAVDKVISDFEGDSRLSHVVVVIGERYCNEAFRQQRRRDEDGAKGYFEKAVVIFDKAVNDIAGCRETTGAYFSAGDCYWNLGQLQKSADRYEKLVNDYPQFWVRGNALFRLGRCYERLAKAGDVSKEAANAKIKAAYEELVEKYPDSSLAGHGRRWLRRHGK